MACQAPIPYLYMLHGDLIVYWMSRLASYHPHLSPSAEPNLLNAFDLYGMHCCDVWMSVGAFVWVRERVVKGFISRGRVGEGI